jgi:hypothetical protein
MHAYPFYIVAAACTVFAVSAGARRFAADRRMPPAASIARGAKLAGAVAAIALLATGVFLALPWFVVREALAKGDSTSVETGGRDFVFYRTGWSASQRDGVVVRISSGERSTVHIPLPETRDYEIVLRMDAIDPAVQHRVGVLVNGQLVARPTLVWDPARVGAYRVRVHAHMVKADNELTIIPDVLVPATSAGTRYGWLDPTERLGVRLWHLRVVPLP